LFTVHNAVRPICRKIVEIVCGEWARSPLRLECRSQWTIRQPAQITGDSTSQSGGGILVDLDGMRLSFLQWVGPAGRCASFAENRQHAESVDMPVIKISSGQQSFADSGYF
jgi:hypothetical protein